MQDKLYDILLGELVRLPPQSPLANIFSKLAHSHEDSLAILLKHQTSAPGINEIPYKVYKKYHKLNNYLLKTFKFSFKKCEIPLQCKVPGKFIPKVRIPLNSIISDFSPIALLNVEEKLFFGLVSRRLETQLIKQPFYKHINAVWMYGKVSWLLRALAHGLEGFLKKLVK